MFNNELCMRSKGVESRETRTQARIRRHEKLTDDVQFDAIFIIKISLFVSYLVFSPRSWDKKGSLELHCVGLFKVCTPQAVSVLFLLSAQPLNNYFHCTMTEAQTKD